jgi:hypothetical protein
LITPAFLGNPLSKATLEWNRHSRSFVPGNGGGGLPQQVTASFSEQSGVSSERKEGDNVWLPGLLHSEQWVEQERLFESEQWVKQEKLSEEIDRESEWLNLNLKPEQHVDEREEAEWQRQALLARQRFESSLAEGQAMRVRLSTFIGEA